MGKWNALPKNHKLFDLLSVGMCSLWKHGKKEGTIKHFVNLAQCIQRWSFLSECEWYMAKK